MMITIRLILIFGRVKNKKQKKKGERRPSPKGKGNQILVTPLRFFMTGKKLKRTPPPKGEMEHHSRER